MQYSGGRRYISILYIRRRGFGKLTDHGTLIIHKEILEILAHVTLNFASVIFILEHVILNFTSASFQTRHVPSHRQIVSAKKISNYINFLEFLQRKKLY